MCAANRCGMATKDVSMGIHQHADPDQDVRRRGKAVVPPGHTTDSLVAASPQEVGLLSPSTILRLQRTIGNAAVNALLTGPLVIQRGKTERTAKKRAERRLRGEASIAYSPRLRARQEQDEQEQDTGPRPPRAGPNGESFWDGSRTRLHFKPATYDNVLATKGNPQILNGVETYECATCHQHFARKRDPRGIANEKFIDLDHQKDWNTYVDLHTDPRAMDDEEGHRWLVFFLEDALAAYNAEDNLVPKCDTHNRSKGGPKYIDKSVKPKHDVANCDACEEP